MVTDVAAFPLILPPPHVPTVCVANFTWADIYEEYIPIRSEFGPIVTKLKKLLRKRRACFWTQASACRCRIFPQRESVGLVARTGENERDRLFAALPPAAQNKRLALVYLGNWGFSLPYEKIRRVFPNGTLYHWKMPRFRSPTGQKISRDLMAHPSLVASVDAVVSKAGYGLVGECLAHGTPLLYPPRTGFAEFAALHKALQNWSGGIFVTNDDWASANFGPYLDAVPPLGTTRTLPAPGGKKCRRRYHEALGRNKLARLLVFFFLTYDKVSLISKRRELLL